MRVINSIILLPMVLDVVSKSIKLFFNLRSRLGGPYSLHLSVAGLGEIVVVVFDITFAPNGASEVSQLTH